MRISKDRKKAHICMVAVLGIWTCDVIGTAYSLSSFNEIFVVFFKTVVALPIVAMIAYLSNNPLNLPEKKDIPIFFVCALLGDVLYFYFEYRAYEYLPVGIISVLLGMMPMFSYAVDCLLGLKKPVTAIFALIAISIVGLVISADIKTLGKINIGYVFCFLCLAVWIVYGFSLKMIGEKYELLRLTFYENICAVIIMMPFALMYRPKIAIPGKAYLFLAALGVLNNGLGYICENSGMIHLGTTVCGLYVNMLPLLTSVGGYLVLGQTMSLNEKIGCAIVVICSIIVVILNERLASTSKDKAPENARNEYIK